MNNRLKLTTIVLTATLATTGCKNNGYNISKVSSARPYFTSTVYDSINGSALNGQALWNSGTYLIMDNSDFIDAHHKTGMQSIDSINMIKKRELESLSTAIHPGNSIKYPINNSKTYVHGRSIKAQYEELQILNADK